MTLKVKAVITVADSRDEAEGPLLPEEDAPSDMASFQPPDSDLPSFLEDCNRVPKPFALFKAGIVKHFVHISSITRQLRFNYCFTRPQLLTTMFYARVVSFSSI